ncbi:hypothetical protein Tco_0909770, partial [Tanacetum coccineum]
MTTMVTITQHRRKEEFLTELDRQEKEATIFLEPEIELFMKATIVEGNGYSQKDKNKANTDKTKHGNEKSMKGWLEADLDTKNLPLFKQRVLCMQTRSSSKFVGEPSTNPTSTIPKRRNRRRSIQRVKPFSLVETPVVTMADQRTMAQLLQAPTEGYEDAI